MGWAKFDDQFTDHPKVQAVGPMAELLAMRAVIYAARYETDGVIRESDLPRLSLGITSPKRQISALLRENLWEICSEGWRIHDFLDYHPSREEKEADRQAARERMANVRANKRRTNERSSGEQAPNKQRSSPYPDPSPTRPDIEQHSPPTPLPAVRWAERWAEVTGTTFTPSVKRAWVPKVQEFIAAGGEPSEELLQAAHRAGIESPAGWGFATGAVRGSDDLARVNEWMRS